MPPLVSQRVIEPKRRRDMRKKIGSIVLAVSILLAWMPDTVMAAKIGEKPEAVTLSQAANQTETDERAAVLSEGSGTETDPYRIQDAGQLRLFADMVNGAEGAADPKLCAVLTKDIDLSTLCGDDIGSWTPIGTKANPYKGIFDGASFVVKGLYYDNPSVSRAGLFGCNAGVIKNLGVAGGG